MRGLLYDMNSTIFHEETPVKATSDAKARSPFTGAGREKKKTEREKERKKDNKSPG